MTPGGSRPRKAHFSSTLPYLILHGGCLGVIWVGWSPFAVGAAIGLYLVRMFAVTAFYHRYFSHRSFRTSRPAQFLFAILASTAMQRGALWWAASHRHHHQHAERGRGPAFPGSSWLSLVAHRLADLSGECRDRLQPDPRLSQVSGIGLPQSPRTHCAHLLRLRYAWVWRDLGTPGSRARDQWPADAGAGALREHNGAARWSLAIKVVGTRLWLPTVYRRRTTAGKSLLLALITLGEGWHNNRHRYPHLGTPGVLLVGN